MCIHDVLQRITAKSENQRTNRHDYRTMIIDGLDIIILLMLLC